MSNRKHITRSSRTDGARRLRGRRSALKLIGSGAVATTGLVSSTGHAKADHRVGYIDGGSQSATCADEYPHEWTDAHHMTNEQFENIERAWQAGIRAETMDEERGEQEIGVQLNVGAATRWTHPDRYSKECKEIESQDIEITYQEGDSEDIIFRKDDDWVGGHELESTDSMHWAYDTMEDVVELGIDQLDNTLGTTYNVAMDTADFIQDVTEYEDNTASKEFSWNYVSDESRRFSGKKDAEARVFFKVYLDKGQEISFDVTTRNWGREYSDVGHKWSMTVGYPDPCGNVQ